MSKKNETESSEKQQELLALAEEVNHWFLDYFQTFIDIGAEKIEPEEILKYWGVPLHTSGPGQSKWLTTEDEVISGLRVMQVALKKIGYTHTIALDKRITVYNENASRVETIMSRRGKDDKEVDRAAVSFEIRRAGKGWTIISATSEPTKVQRLELVW